MSNWNEVKREGDVSTWRPEVNEALEGVLTEITRNLGENKATLYVVTTANDEKVGAWETSVLRSKLERLPIGTEVKIVYLGKRKSKAGPGSYHDFQVFTRPKTEAEKVFMGEE